MNTSLYQIIIEAQNATGSKEKTAILMKYKNNTLLKVYLKTVADPSISYYIASVPFVSGEGTIELDASILFSVIYILAERKLTGNAAREWLGNLIESLTGEGQFLIGLLIARKIGGGIGDTMILKVYPGLFFLPMYSRCSLLNPKIKETFDEMKFFYCQQKMDGSFSWATKDNEGKSSLVTRAGNYYPSWISNKVLEGIPNGNALAGELLVYENYKVLDRQTGNGILNSILSGDEETVRHSNYEYRMTAWDSLTYDEYSIQKESKLPYQHRLEKTVDLVDVAPNMLLVETTTVYSVEEAFSIYGRYLSEGKEGCIIKSPEGLLKDNTSKDNVKLKLSFEFEVEIEGYYEGEGKNSGMLGGMSIKSSCGQMKSNVGSGYTDAQRIHLWSMGDNLIGKIITVKANDILGNLKDDNISLNLPIFLDTRFNDRNEADSLTRIVEQRNAARSGAKSA